MMNKDEMLDDLESKHIIIQVVPGKYLLTEKYKELLENRVASPVIPVRTQYDELLERKAAMSHWPFSVLETTGRNRMLAFMDSCSIPTRAGKGYYLRGVTTEAVNVLDRIILDKHVDPETMIQATTLYYQHTEMPKGFSKFLVEGLAREAYQEHLEGKLKSNLVRGEHDGKSNQHWS